MAGSEGAAREEASLGAAASSHAEKMILSVEIVERLLCFFFGEASHIRYIRDMFRYIYVSQFKNI